MPKKVVEKDSTYFLKLFGYLVVALFWLQLGGHTIFPIGLVVGLGAAQHEKLQIDRRVEYAVLLVAAIVAAVTGKGFFFNISAHL